MKLEDWDLSFQPDHYYVEHGSLLFEKRCSLSYPFIANHYCIRIAGLRGVRKRRCEVLQYTVWHIPLGNDVYTLVYLHGLTRFVVVGGLLGEITYDVYNLLDHRVYHYD